jgi:hypothetical protein
LTDVAAKAFKQFLRLTFRNDPVFGPDCFSVFGQFSDNLTRFLDRRWSLVIGIACEPADYGVLNRPSHKPILVLRVQGNELFDLLKTACGRPEMASRFESHVNARHDQFSRNVKSSKNRSNRTSALHLAQSMATNCGR